eukprot:m.83416 g.83416  ORF g.83416 m.83416 type:complete len:336 (+) comp14766_c0_seq3:430-1437(+)
MSRAVLLGRDACSAAVRRNTWVAHHVRLMATVARQAMPCPTADDTWTPDHLPACDVMPTMPATVAAGRTCGVQRCRQLIVRSKTWYNVTSAAAAPLPHLHTITVTGEATTATSATTATTATTAGTTGSSLPWHARSTSPLYQPTATSREPFVFDHHPLGNTAEAAKPGLPEDPGQNSPNQSRERRDREHMALALTALRAELPRSLLTDNKIDSDLYDANIRLVDLIHGGIHVEGRARYAMALSFFRQMLHLNFSSPEFHLLSLTPIPERKAIRCRWQIEGTPRLRLTSTQMTTFDAVSTFYLNADGKLQEHEVDQLTPASKTSVFGADGVFCSLR